MLGQGFGHASRLTRRVGMAVLRLLVLGYFIFCALFLTLRYAVLPNIDMYKTDIEQLASRAIGLPVSIARIYASWHGLKPNLFLGDVVVRDKDGRQALSLPSVSATLSWWSVLSAKVRFDTLQISRPDLDIRRDADGRIYLAGILFAPGQGGDGQGPDWVLSQREIVIREGRLRWNDAQRNAPELLLEDVNLILHNQWRHHRLGLHATPPAEFAAPVDIRADFVHPRFARTISDMAQWKGELYADVPQTDLASWKTYVDYPFELTQGKGAVRAWLTFDHAKVANFTADLRLADVSTRLRQDLQTLNLVKLQGRIAAREYYDQNAVDSGPTFGAHGHTLSLIDVSMQTRDGLYLPATTVTEKFIPARKNQPEKGEFTASRLDLDTLASFAAHLPLLPGQRRMLADYAPRGQLSNFSAQWQGSYPQLAAYNVKGQFSGLTMRAQDAVPAKPQNGATPAQPAMPAIPGFDNLSGQIDASQKGGRFSLESDRLVLYLPSYLDTPAMPFDHVGMQANWSFPDSGHVLMQVDRMEVLQDGLSASLAGKYRMPLQPGAKDKGSIDATAKIASFDINRVGRYLPQQTPQHLRDWLSGALLGGRAHDVSMTLKGELANFPFHIPQPGGKPSGVFKLAGKIDNGSMNYVPGVFGKDGKAPLWPLLEEVKGSFTYDRARLEIKGDSGKTLGAALSNVKARIPDLLSGDSMLEIEGNAAGPMQEFVAYVNASPVAGWINNFTDDTKAGGNAKLALKLQLPLHHVIDARVQGTVQLANNDVNLLRGLPPLLKSSGKLEFTEKGLNLNGVKAGFLGGQMQLSGGALRSGVLIKASGNATAEGLRKTYATPAMQGLTARISGATRYAATIGVKNNQLEIAVESPLQGLGLDFPAPLRKSAGETMPLKFQLSGLPASGNMQRDEIRLSLGGVVSTRYQRQKPVAANNGSGTSNAPWRVTRGGIGVNAPAPEPDSGLVANVELASLNIDAWRAIAASVVATDSPPPKAVQAEAADAMSIAQYVEPDSLAARASELIVMGKKLDNVVVGASHQKNVWQANINSVQAAGYLTWYEAGPGGGFGKVTARLASLTIPKSGASEVSDLLGGKTSSTQIPALDVVAEQFELMGKRMGRLELVANNNMAASGREWRINKLSIINADAELKATGKWSVRAGESISSLSYDLDIANAGQLLERFGFANVLRGGKGNMLGDVQWSGLPFSMDIPTLSGQLQLSMEAGQFLKVDPGAAKLLGVLSLQSLPRRLSLDFRDVFSEGFAFDGISATATINKGWARTDNLKMRSVSATVLMDGTADLVKETQNLHVAVLPEINVGAASVLYGLAVNPVVGLGTFLAQLFLRDPLRRAFTFEYNITGPWSDPVVAKRSATQAAAPAPAPAN